jgi:hypothetical protein
MARFSRSCGCSILAALVLVCLIDVPPVAAESVLRIAHIAEPETLDPHKAVVSSQVNTGKLDVTALGVAAPDERTARSP